MALTVLLMAASFGACGEQTAPEGPPQAGGVEGVAETEVITLDDVTGEDGADAESTITALGLSVGFTAGGADEDIAEPRSDPSGCEVVDQDPQGGTEIEPGGEVELALDCRQVDWENQDGDEWEAWSSAYEDGHLDGCNALFALSPDGSLYDDDTEYTSLDCPSNADPSDDPPGDVPDDPEADGASAGFDAGCDAFFDDQAVTELYYGEDYYTADDCRGSGSAQAAVGDTESASPSCSGRTPAGDPFEIAQTAGDVRCEGAKALWLEYLRRVGDEGKGSGGAVDGIDGWGCISAPAARGETELGSCDQEGSGASFRVVPAS